MRVQVRILSSALNGTVDQLAGVVPLKTGNVWVQIPPVLLLKQRIGDKMSRTFAPISIDELRIKIDAVCGDEGVRPLLDKLGKDIKVEFDLENVSYNESDPGPEKMLGYHSENGLTWCGLAAGGDWEHPVFFLIYWDGKKLRGYVPTDGNPWNSITKQAYGNDEEKDLQDAKKRWPTIFGHLEEVESGDFDFDTKAIHADIFSRLTPAAGAAKKAAKKSIQERIESLKFYGTGDEAYELFQATCSLCYQMNGLGDPSQAETLCKWAEDMAIQSYEDAVQYDNLEDVEDGYWGRQ
jgi:hypothetical protein